jgi:hypothetical protein
MRLLPLVIALATFSLALTACRGNENEAEAPDPATIESPVPAGSPVAPPPETPEAAEHVAGGQHAHGAPHGGTVKEAGSGHLEAVVMGRNLLIYVLDANEADVPVEGIAGAQVVIQQQSGSVQTVALEPMADHLMATVPAGVRAYTAIVTVPFAGEDRSARFEVGLDGDFEHAR